MTVPTSSIVERLNVVRDLGLRDLSVLEDSLLDQLFLETPEEGFRHGIVPAISSSAHTWLEMIGATKASPIVAPVLASLIRVNDRSTRPTSAYGHEHCIDNELAADRRLHRPADDLAREEIHDHRKVEPALPGSDVSDVRDPGTVRLSDVEFALQNVGNQCRGL
jgi:hypothetical protein